MAIDTSIYSQVGKGGNLGDLVNSYAADRQAHIQGRLSDLQLSEAERNAAQGKAVSEAYSGNIGADGKVDYGKMYSQLASGGHGAAIPGLQKTQAEQEKAAMAAEAEKLKLGRTKFQYFAQALQPLLQLENIDDDSVLRTLNGAIGQGYLTREAGVDFFKNLPPNPTTRRELIRNAFLQVLDADKQLEALLPKVQAQNLGGTTQMVDTNPLTNPAVVGQTFQRTATPGEVESARHNAIAESNMVRGQNMTDARARDFNQTKVEENKLKREAKEDAANQAKANQLASFDTMMGTLDRLSKHPGLARSVGFTGAFPTFPGSDSANFKAELETFKSQAFIPMVSQLKGMGALSDAEGKKLSAAVGALDSTMSEDAFRESIGTIIKDMKAARDRMAGAPKTAGNPPPPDLAGLEAEMRRRGLLK